jgi:hypothetical protein
MQTTTTKPASIEPHIPQINDPELQMSKKQSPKKETIQEKKKVSESKTKEERLTRVGN